jgi:hypothetical protein
MRLSLPLTKVSINFPGQSDTFQHQLELLLQGLPNVTTLPAAAPKTTTATRNGVAHPVRRMLAEDKLETQEIVIEPEEVQIQPNG